MLKIILLIILVSTDQSTPIAAMLATKTIINKQPELLTQHIQQVVVYKDNSFIITKSTSKSNAKLIKPIDVNNDLLTIGDITISKDLFIKKRSDSNEKL